MDLKNNVEIINFLKSISKVYQETGGEIIIHCPYCDDAMRPKSRDHGHLYISTTSPVFHCFRCETSGFLGSLLKDLGFQNLEILSEFGTTFKFLQFKEKSVIGKGFDRQKSISEIIQLKNYKYKLGDQNNYLKFEKYIYSRLGNYCDINNYLITPEIKDKKLCAAFYNKDGFFSTARILEPTNNFRYVKNSGNSEFYYFQELDFDHYKNIVLTEGVFDAIKLFRFSDQFPKNTTFYMAILGKNYGSAISWLLSAYIPVGKYSINLVFDNDNVSMKKNLFLCRKITKRINTKIEIFGWKPILLNDAAEYPFLEKI